ncbi:MAG: hypothetical protein VX478_02750 [Chloroflexota bacterium]|nr:hypothetical protein [Chloroflexota bacterium]
MIELYFITVLVVTTNTIPQGWLQWTSSFSDKAICEEAIVRDKTDIVMAVSEYLKRGGKHFVMAKEIKCMSYDEAVKRNTELGH